MQQTTWSRQHARDNMQQILFSTTCSRQNAIERKAAEMQRTTVWRTTVRQTTVQQRQHAADNSATCSGQAADGSLSGGAAGGSDMRARGSAPRRRDLLRLPGHRRLRHTNTACGTRVRACIPPKQATWRRQPTAGRPDLQHATNRTCYGAGRSRAVIRGLAHRRKATDRMRRARTDNVP